MRNILSVILVYESSWSHVLLCYVMPPVLENKRQNTSIVFICDGHLNLSIVLLTASCHQ